MIWFICLFFLFPLYLTKLMVPVIGDNNIVFNTFDRLFDLAIMMDGSQSPVHPALVKSSSAFARKHCETVRKHGATPILFETWAYADKPGMTAPLAEAYARMGAENDVMVIPAGQAFARSLAARPDIGTVDGLRQAFLNARHVAYSDSASGELADGTKVNGVVELRKALLARPEMFVNAATEKLLTYALGRGLDPRDMPQVRAVVRSAAKENYTLTSIVMGIVNSDAFRKQAPEPPVK